MTAPPDHPAGRSAGGDEEPTPTREEELRAWLSQYEPGLRRYFSRRAPASEIDDLVQEVFLRLHARSTAQPLESVERYMFRIAGNVLIDRRRNDLAHGRNLNDQFDDGFDPRDDITPERALIAREDYVRLIVAIRDLPPKTKAAFILHRFEQMTYPAIAKRMGISLSGVKHLITRALDHLGEEMDQP